MNNLSEVNSFLVPKDYRTEASVTLLPSETSSCVSSKQFSFHRQCKSDDQRFVITIPTEPQSSQQLLGHKQTRSDGLYPQYKPPPSYYVLGRGSLRGEKSFVSSSQIRTGSLGATNGTRTHSCSGTFQSAPNPSYSTAPVVYISTDTNRGNVAQCHFAPVWQPSDNKSSQQVSTSLNSTHGIMEKLMTEMKQDSKTMPVSGSNIPSVTSTTTKFSQERQLAIARFREELIGGSDAGYSSISREHRKMIHMHSQRTLLPGQDNVFYVGGRSKEGSTMPTASVSEPSSASGTLRTDHEAIATRAAHMVGILSEENKSLRQELDGMYQKVAKLQKFEQDISRVQTDHEMLVESTRKREQLEVVYKWKLENEIKRLQAYNRQLIAKLERLSVLYQSKESSDPMSKGEPGELHTELSKRDAVIVELAQQRQEADVNYQRMEEELSAQRATLDEQRLHIEVLDNALSNAQANVVKLQEECKRRQSFVEKATDLQKLVTTLQKRVEIEAKIRTDREQELETLKGEQVNGLQDEGVSGLEAASDSTSLVDLLKEREQKIARLEADVCKWEQKYYEQSSQSTNQSTCNITTEGVPEEDVSHDNAAEFSLSVQRIGMLEARVGTLQAELKQKDTLVQVLRQQILERDTALPSPTASRPQSVSPHSSLQNIRRNSMELLLNRSSPTASSSSLQSLNHKSPHSSNQNLAVGASPRSPVTSMQNLSLVSRSPLGSQQNLVFVRGPVIQMGSQERVSEGESPAYSSHMVHSGGSTVTHSGSNESNLAMEREVLDEKLRLLDQEIMERDKILDNILK